LASEWFRIETFIVKALGNQKKKLCKAANQYIEIL